MTQVKEWSNQELNRKLAELMGWTEIYLSHRMLCGNAPDDRESIRIPDYCTDPAASLEVEKAAVKMNAKKYFNCLENLIHPELEGCPDSDAWFADEIAEFVNATPRERAEAAYITLQGVKDHE